MKLSFRNSRGEIATTFAVISFVVILVGAFFGSRQVVRDKVNTLFSRAQGTQVVINCDPALSTTGCRAKISNLRFTPSSNNQSRFIFTGKLCFDTLPGESIPSNAHYFVRFYQSGVMIASDKASVGSQPNRARCDSVGLRFRSIIIPSNASCSEMTIEAGLEHTMNGSTSSLIQSTYNVVNAPVCTIATPTPGTTVPTSTPALCNYHTDAMIRIDSDSGDVLTKVQNGTTGDWGVSSDRHLAESPTAIVNKFGSKEVNTLLDLNFYGPQATTTYHNDHHKFFPDNPASKYRAGEKASMTLMGLDTEKWKIVGKYCKPLSSSATGCPDELVFQPIDNTITNLPQVCGTDIEYGWVVESLIDPTATPTPTAIRAPTATPTPTPTTIAIPTATNTPTPIPTGCTMTAKYVVKDESGAVLNTNQFMVPGQWGIVNNKQTPGQKTTFSEPNAERTVQLSTADGTLKFKCADTSNPKCDPNALFVEGEKASIRLLTDETYTVTKKSITRCGEKTNPLDYQCDHKDPITAGAINEIPGVPLKCNMEYVFEFYVKRNACTYNSKVTIKDELGNILTQDKMMNGRIEFDANPNSESNTTDVVNYPWGISNNKQDQTKPAILFDKESAIIELNSNSLKLLPVDPTAQYRYGEKASIKLFHFPGFRVNKWTVKQCGTNPLDVQCDNLVGPIPGKNPAVIDGIPMKCNMKYEFEYQLTPEICDPDEFDITYGSCGGQSSSGPTQFCASNQRPRFICQKVVRNGQTIGLRVPDPDNRCETVPSCPHTITPPANNNWPKCQKLRGDGKYKLIFVPQGFTDRDELLRYVTSTMDWVYKVNLTSDQIKHFSFYINTEMTKDFYYDFGNNRWINQDKLTKISRECDGLAPILIARNPIFSGFTYLDNIKLPIVMTTEALTNGRATLSHELGHHFGQLNDEYVYGLAEGISPTMIPSDEDNPKANCTKQNDSVCSKWRGKSYFRDIVCSQGCTTINRFRSTFNSIMAYDWLDRKFNNVSIEEWDRQLGIFNASSSLAQSVLDKPTMSYHNVIKLVFKQASLNELQLTSATVDQTYPDLPLKQNNHDYSISVNDAQGAQVYSYDVDAYETQVVEGDMTGDGGGTTTKLKDTIIAYLPYAKNGQTIKIHNKQGLQTFSANIADLSLAPPVENQNLCGNGICDSRNGENNLSCSADCRIATPPVATPTPTATPPVSLCRSTDMNGDRTINTLDYAYLIKRYRQRTDIVRADLNCDGKVNAYDTSLLLGELGKRLN